MKKLLLKLLGPRLLDTACASPKEYLQVKELNNGTEYAHEALGISEERLIEIRVAVQSALNKCFKEHKSTVCAMEIVSQKLTHANELVMATIEMERVCRQQYSPIASILGAGNH